MFSLTDLILLLESFEVHMGNPLNQQAPINFKKSVLYDEQETLPYTFMAYINQWGYTDFLIPSHLNGKLHSFVELYLLNKIIARRDLTLAVAMGLSFFAALPTWIAGTLDQQKDLSIRLRRGEIGALALTEEEHGSDLTANEMNAEPCQTGWYISGSKWCVNFATLSQTVTVLSRTHPKGGLLGFSLFFIDKARIGPGITYVPKLTTHGVRGLDISGFSLDKVQVTQDNLIGEEQRGLEIIYKVFQISRTLCACLAVGGADTALRLTVDFSLQRYLYGKSAFEIPSVTQRLGEQFVQLLIADCTSLIVVRACTLMPKKMSFWSAIIKFLIPKMCEDIVEQCGIILGARAYLRTTDWAIFQKIRRDIQVVGLFDGSSQVNLSLIASNLLPQVGMRGTKSENDLSCLEQLFNLQLPCLCFEEDKMSLFCHEEDDIVAGLIKIDSKPIALLVTALQQEIARLDQKISLLKEQKQFDPRGLAAFKCAEHYSWIFAACCCVQFWYYNQATLAEELKDTAWLSLALQFILNKLGSNQTLDKALQEKSAQTLCHYFQQKKMFSVIPTKIAE
jgi:alkylation response protein AidB-like acyl-CoA dehydrogenase